jgi:hypothetical protein
MKSISRFKPPLSLQVRLWNQAHDNLKEIEPKVVATFERILSAELIPTSRAPPNPHPIENNIEKDWKIRSHQMQQLVKKGLEQTKKEASMKRGIDESLQAAQAVRGIVDRAVRAAPEAAVAWAGVCLGLEVV